MKKIVVIIILFLGLVGLGVTLYASWCTQEYCGCADVPGYMLSSWSCSCSSEGQTRRCRYIPVN